jgi:hypothetical protein
MAKATADIRSLARTHTKTAIRTLVSIMSMKDAPPAARVSAASYLLDRGWGKAPQQMQHSGEIKSTVHFTWQPMQPTTKS